MIFKWKRPRLKIVPLKLYGGSVTLIQGYNDIPDDHGEDIMKIIQSSIDNGDIEVIRKEVDAEDLIGDGKKKGKIKIKKFVAIPFKELDFGKKLQIISETDDPKSLKKWLDSETDDVIRIDLKKRTEAVEVFLKTGVKPKDQ